MQLRYICPHCGRVEQTTKDTIGQVTLGWPCVHTACSCGLRNRYVNVIIDAIRCLACFHSDACKTPKVFPFKGTLKQIKKKRARNSVGRVSDF